MNNLIVTVENVNGVLVTTSNRVAGELGVRHDNLMRKIDDYCEKFGLAIPISEFYIESTYENRGKQYRNYLITKKGMEMIMQNSYFTTAEQLEKAKFIYEKLGGKDVKLISASTRFEISFVDILEKALNELGIKGVRQYVVGDYRIDFYIPSKKIAVEYDEQQHQYHIKEDKTREEYIERELGCKFVRCDYRDSDIKNVMKVVKEVM